MRSRRPSWTTARAALALVFGLAAATLAAHADAATITVVNNDGAGEGFNDPTVVSPVGGNPGTTLGAQRLNAFQFAANIWAGLLTSSVTIFVDATMDPLFCDSTSALLGQAGATTLFRDFSGALVAGTWYPQALANKLHGSDLDPGSHDIVAQFNSSIGTTCPFSNVWYYGFDASGPPTDFDFVSVVLHELGHGLGFFTVVDLSTGAKAGGFDDTFMRNLKDKSVGLLWSPMSNAQRQASAIDGGDLYWTGAAVTANSGFLTSGRDVSGNVLMYAPNPLEPGSSVSHFDTSCSPDQLLEAVYTGPNHNPQLARDVMIDIGWGSAATTTTTSTTTSTTPSTGGTTSTSSSTTSSTSTTHSTSTSIVTSISTSSTTTTTLAAVGHLKCYKTKDPRPKVPYRLDLITTVAAFPNTLGCTLKPGAKRVCVEVDKQNVTPSPPGGGPTVPPNGGSVFLSYKLKCPKQSVAPVTFVDQFGVGSLTVRTPGELLVPALPGPANDHFECYKVKAARPKAASAYVMDLAAGVAGFTNELRCSIKLGARRACIQVNKENVMPPPPGGGPGPGPGSGGKFLGYKLRCPTGSLPPAGITDQFGGGTFTPVKPSLFLVPAS